MRDAEDDAAAIRGSLTDPRAFAQIFDRHFVAIHAYLARRLGRGLADDLAGEVFRRALEGRHRYDTAHSNARPWLFGIATNLIRRHYRDEQRRLSAYARAGALSVTAVVDPLEEIDDSLVARALSGRLAEALSGLATGDRDALLLLAWEYLSYQEIAVALGIPIGTVRSRLSRARRQLRELLGGSGQVLGDQTADAKGGFEHG